MFHNLHYDNNFTRRYPTYSYTNARIHGHWPICPAYPHMRAASLYHHIWRMLCGGGGWCEGGTIVDYIPPIKLSLSYSCAVRQSPGLPCQVGTGCACLTRKSRWLSYRYCRYWRLSQWQTSTRPLAAKIKHSCGCTVSAAGGNRNKPSIFTQNNVF